MPHNRKLAWQVGTIHHSYYVTILEIYGSILCHDILTGYRIV